ncbi:MAG: PAS domain-containing protein [Caldilineaceae bacterium]|nr:PAS domain-containing protein [Caldilineaceae bacterium]
MSLLWELLDSKTFVLFLFSLLVLSLAVTMLRLFIVSVQQRNAEIRADERATQADHADKQLRQTLGALQAQVWYLDTEARVVDFNLFTQTFLQLSPLQVRGRPMSAILSNWYNAAACQERNLRVIQSGEADIGTVESYGSNGRTHWVRVDRIPSFDEGGRIDGLMLFIYDITTLKSTEQALRFQKTLLEAQSESSLDGIWVVSQQRRWLSFNQRFVDMWDIPTEIVNAGESDRTFHFMVNQLADPAAFQSLVQMLSANPTLTHTDVLRLQDGRHVDWFSTPIVGDDGQQYGRAWYFRDVTETHQTESALRDSEARNRALVNSIPDMLFRVRADGTFLDYHGASGYTPMMDPANFLGRRAEEVFAPPVARQFMQKLQDTLQRNSVQIYDYEMPMRNGEIRHWEQRLVAASDDEILVIIRDITTQKRAETALREAHNELERRVQERTAELSAMNIQLQTEVEERRRTEDALRESEERLELALHGADLELVDIDLQSGKALYHQQWHVHNGYQRNQFYDTFQRWLESIHTDDCPSVVQALEKHLCNQVPFFEHEYRIRAGDDTWRWVRCRGRVVSRDADQQPLRFSGTQMDITEYKQLEQQLLQSQKMEAVGRLAGGVAHDFNNILTVIISYSELALRQLHSQKEGKQEGRLQKRLEEIRKAAEKATRLTRQLLLFSRSETVSPVVLDLNRLVIDVETMLERLIGDHIHLDMKLEPTINRIKADPGQIEQILLNLIVNARDAMAEGGTIQLATERVCIKDGQTAPNPRIQPGSYVALVVTDTGCGMDAATQERIFEPFFTTKGPGKGTGLGLATVFGAVKQNHGYIHVQSEVNQGTTFRIYFPALPQTMSEYLASTDDVEPAPRGVETILLVEDEEHIRSLAHAALQEAGYTVIPAANGEEALALTARHRGPIHLIVTDVIMPGMSGVKLSHQVMSLRPSTKILYISGYTDGELNMSERLDREQPFLPKPFTPSLLALKVRHVLDTPRVAAV